MCGRVLLSAPATRPGAATGVGGILRLPATAPRPFRPSGRCAASQTSRRRVPKSNSVVGLVRERRNILLGQSERQGASPGLAVSGQKPLRRLACLKSMSVSRGTCKAPSHAIQLLQQPSLILHSVHTAATVRSTLTVVLTGFWKPRRQATVDRRRRGCDSSSAGDTQRNSSRPTSGVVTTRQIESESSSCRRRLDWAAPRICAPHESIS
jgi:hypothetical protein